jgi:hypothetical protein
MMIRVIPLILFGFSCHFSFIFMLTLDIVRYVVHHGLVSFPRSTSTTTIVQPPNDDPSLMSSSHSSFFSHFESPHL